MAEEVITEVKAAVQAAYADIEKKTDSLAEVIEVYKAKLDEKADTTDIDGRLKDVQEELAKSEARADEIERKANRGGNAEQEAKSVGDLFVETDEYKAFSERRGGTATFDLKAITSLHRPPFVIHCKLCRPCQASFANLTAR